MVRRGTGPSRGGSLPLHNPNLVVRRRRAGRVRSRRDFVSPNGWKPDARDAARLPIAGGRVALVSGFPTRGRAHEHCGADTRLRSQTPFVTSGMTGAFLGEGLKAVVPGVRHGWDAFGDVFLKR